MNLQEAMRPENSEEPIKLLILQASPFCNIACRYCYLSLSERNDARRMPLETVEQAARFVAGSGRLQERLTVLWHAGEPLAVPIPYYREAIARIRKHLPADLKLSFNFQTNAVGLKEEWCDFIKSEQIAIGVSVDGPEHVHDAMRVSKAGKGTFRHVLAGIRNLQKHGVPFSTISVVSEATLAHPRDTMEFLYSLDSQSIGFNIEETEGYNSVSSVSGRAGDVLNFVRFVHDWLNEKGDIERSREYRSILQQLAFGSGGHAVRRGENKAFSIITIAVDGRVSTFSPELCGFPVDGLGDFTFGHVSEPFARFASDESLTTAFRAVEQGVQNCAESCEYFDLCGGGAPSNKWQENRALESTETIHCTFHKQFFANVLIEQAARVAAE
jgi:uncharacterized protein